FAAAVLAFAANMLTSVLKSEATTSVIKELGNQATGLANQGLARLPGLLASIPGKIAARVRARRDRRRAARMNNN
nr:Chain aa, p70 [Nudaurelia capensis omega virus]7ANM_bb Chain bb, p70 [Nudaurelia capensis omega virus]7ANM_cc Chain cc, p70 [Nudaurelia capensis omega virus]7ANM_dd Chain dd, p70 [Nudaurelia capensis omega virus]7ATA_aa Chain aa, p70 [Nudaurelia capensis omega virus]7ATA_bb Chain bb, p70 [Nudaurelia capensis omega virus]7ATA_cc Chain cc, p70 [Nudaurelia capensis omega virus]7ATA_dd Chain dd, p70 [Nudaurelia capensis omega virus]